MRSKRLSIVVLPITMCLSCTATLRSPSDADAQRGDAGRPPAGESNETPAPKITEAAPLFDLKTLDGKGRVDLAGFSGKQPVLLFFGSYT